jgi:NAD(P)-dependent dehydrogenase (short-subunit alcohol dehydrogenase family)
MTHESKVWFITGVSRGFGKILAETLLADGATVIGTTRNGSAAIARGRGRLTLLALEMTDPRAVKEAVETAFGLGRVDVIVNNAGYGLLSSVEEASEEQVAHLFEVNFHGPRRVIQAALPHLRAQRSGHIVNITSIAGVAPAAGSGYYAAAKMAVEGMSQSLAREVAPLGIRVTLVEPGAFRTDFLSDRSIRRGGTSIEDYATTAGAAERRLATMAGRQPGDPARAAAAIIEAVRSDKPPLHLVLGSDAYQRTREVLEAFSAELDAWKQVCLGTDFGAAGGVTPPSSPRT